MINQKKTKELFIEQLKRTPIVQVICEKLGVSRATFYRMKNQDKKFGQEADEAISEGRQLVNEIAESKLLAAIQSGNLSSIYYWLNHNSSIYSNKLEIKGKIATSKELTPKQEDDIKRAPMLADLKEVKNEKE